MSPTFPHTNFVNVHKICYEFELFLQLQSLQVSSQVIVDVHNENCPIARYAQNLCAKSRQYYLRAASRSNENPPSQLPEDS